MSWYKKDGVILWFTTGERARNGYLKMVCLCMATTDDGVPPALPTVEAAERFLANAQNSEGGPAYPDAKPVYFERTRYRMDPGGGERYLGRIPIDRYVDGYNKDCAAVRHKWVQKERERKAKVGLKA